MSALRAADLPVGSGEPKCQAMDEHFDISCGAQATVVGSLGEKWGYLCSDCANRAIQHGWTIGPTVRDVQAAVARVDQDAK